jgi:hypothetical protein
VPYFKPGKELKEFFTDTPEEGEAGEPGAEAAAPETEPAPSPVSEPPIEEHPVHEEHVAEPSGSSSEAAGGGSHPTGSSQTGSGD